MKLRPEQLSSYLRDCSDRVFFLSGEEPLQMQEAADLIRQYALEQGFDERQIITFDGGHGDWTELTAAAMELSLFSQKKILDVRLSHCQPGAKGSQAIRDYMANVPDDKFLLLQTAKLDKSARQAAWVKALDEQGVMIQVWDLSPAQTLGWVAKRMREHGLQPSQDAVRLLTERIEGNLLAANQEIKKLLLLFGAGAQIDVDQVMQVVADSSRFSVFDLSDAILLGDIKRLHHVLKILREEDTALQLVLWSLSTLSRQLYDICQRIMRGEAEARAIQSAGFIPRPRQALFPPAIRRLRDADWTHILQQNFEIETMTKGQAETRIRDESRIWDKVFDTAVLLSGHRLV